MNVTVRFANLFYLSLFCAVLLLTGWAIGARWGHSATAGYALFWAMVALVVHDIAIAVLAGISGYKAAMHVRNKDGGQRTPVHCCLNPVGVATPIRAIFPYPKTPASLFKSLTTISRAYTVTSPSACSRIRLRDTSSRTVPN
jgi:hypothetical protein